MEFAAAYISAALDGSNR